jgi:protein-S-isoprenylcysteine O-methyltransferase Ste14
MPPIINGLEMTDEDSTHDRLEGASFGEEYPRSDEMQVAMFIVFLLLWIIDSFFLRSTTLLATYIPLPMRLFVAGVSIVSGLYLINESHKLVIDEVPAEPALVDSGVYSRFRHPMYMGVLLTYLGLISSTMSVVSFGLLLGVFVAYDKFAAYEEQDLTRLLGEEYVDYKRRVPRWVPRILPDKLR